MSIEYREIKEGDIRQEGDEFSKKGCNKWSLVSGDYGHRYSDALFDEYEYRRSVSSDESDTYATPTDKITAKMAGKVDMKMAFALAPLDAVFVSLRTGDYSLSPASDEDINEFELVEIPERDRELNRWADTYKTWAEVTKNETLIVNAPAITENDFYERRALRHPESDDVLGPACVCGELLVNHPNGVACGDKQPSSKWLPEVGEEYEVDFSLRCFSDDAGGELIIPEGTKVEINGHADFGNGTAFVYSGRINGKWFYTIGGSHVFRPLKTAEQVPDDEQPQANWLPEVGEDFQFSANGVSWEERTMLFKDGVSLLMSHKKYPANRWHYKIDDPDIKFRPLKTAEQRAEDERNKFIEAALLATSACDEIGEIYDWLNSGATGYRLTKKDSE